MENCKKFDAVEMSRKLKRKFAKKWTDKNGNPDWEKLKKILRQWKTRKNKQDPEINYDSNWKN